MVYKVNINPKQIDKLYEELKLSSKNFENINALVLAENSQRLVIFRLALGLSTEEFAKICNRSQSSIYNLEKKARVIDINTADYYIKIIRKLKINNLFNLNAIKSNYRRFYGRALNGVSILSKKEIEIFAKQGSEAALKKRKENREEYFKASRKGIKLQKLTQQEKEISQVLDKLQINYKTHEFVERENVDFYLESKNPIAINCCRVNNQNNITKHARRLVYQGYRIKYKNKSIKYIVVLSNKNKNLDINHVYLGAVDLLNEICDAWFVDSNINNLFSFISVDSILQAHQA